MSFEAIDSRTLIYHSRVIKGLSIKQGLVQQCNKLWIPIIILTVRCLLLSVFTFLFEMSFMKSMNTQLVAYLKKYSTLRRLNIRW